MIDRRQFCKVSAGICALSGIYLPLSPVQAFTSDLGAGKKLTIFSDGVMQLPLHMLFGSVDKDRLESVFPNNSDTDTIISRPLNVVLYEKDDKKILFDAGGGIHFLSGLGQLPSALAAAGLDMSDITDVIFTHAHPDHIWGIMDDFDEIYMPQARYFISRAEWDFWESPATLERLPDERKNFAVGAKTRFDLIRDSVRLFDFGDEVLPSIEAVDARGHTPGHTAFLLHDTDVSTMIIGDAVIDSLVSFQHFDWENDADMDAQQAVKTRAVLLDRVHSDSLQICGYHLPHPGVGYVEKSGLSWRYRAV